MNTSGYYYDHVRDVLISWPTARERALSVYFPSRGLRPKQRRAPGRFFSGWSLSTCFFLKSSGMYLQALWLHSGVMDRNHGVCVGLCVVRSVGVLRVCASPGTLGAFCSKVTVVL